MRGERCATRAAEAGKQRCLGAGAGVEAIGTRVRGSPGLGGGRGRGGRGGGGGRGGRRRKGGKGQRPADGIAEGGIGIKYGTGRERDSRPSARPRLCRLGCRGASGRLSRPRCLPGVSFLGPPLAAYGCTARQAPVPLPRRLSQFHSSARHALLLSSNALYGAAV